MAANQEEIEFQKWQDQQNGYIGKEAKAKWRDNYKSQQIDKTFAGQYSDPNKTGFKLTGTGAEKEAAQEGLNFAKTAYGQNIFQTGQDIAGIRDRLKSRSEQNDPISEAIRSQKAGAMAGANRSLAASGVKGGAAAGAVDQIGRSRDADIAASLYGQQAQSIQDERSLASNTLSGTTALMQGGKAEGTQMPNAPKAASWTDSVICTELHRQGRMPTHIYLKDAEYGILLEQYYPEVLEGYHLLAKPVVKLMRASKLFSKLISYPALRWAYFIAGEEESILGYCIFHIGQPICAIIGKIKRLGVKYVPFCNN
jgi:hypothetical protein